MKKQETVLKTQDKRVLKITLMKMLGEELEKILQNKLVVRNFSKIEEFAEEYIHEVEMGILANTAHAKIRKELSKKKGKK